MNKLLKYAPWITILINLIVMFLFTFRGLEVELINAKIENNTIRIDGIESQIEELNKNVRLLTNHLLGRDKE